MTLEEVRPYHDMLCVAFAISRLRCSPRQRQISSHHDLNGGKCDAIHVVLEILRASQKKSSRPETKEITDREFSGLTQRYPMADAYHRAAVRNPSLEPLVREARNLKIWGVQVLLTHELLENFVILYVNLLISASLGRGMEKAFDSIAMSLSSVTYFQNLRISSREKRVMRLGGPGDIEGEMDPEDTHSTQPKGQAVLNRNSSLNSPSFPSPFEEGPEPNAVWEMIRYSPAHNRPQCSVSPSLVHVVEIHYAGSIDSGCSTTTERASRRQRLEHQLDNPTSPSHETQASTEQIHVPQPQPLSRGSNEMLQNRGRSTPAEVRILVEADESTEENPHERTNNASLLGDHTTAPQSSFETFDPDDTERPWKKLVAVINPLEPVIIDEMLAHAYKKIPKGPGRVNNKCLLHGLPSHDECLQEAEVEAKLSSLEFDAFGARKRLPETYRVFVISYMIITFCFAVAVASSNVGKKESWFGQAQDFVYVISLFWGSAFGLIKVAYDPDVLRNLALKKRVFRDADQVYGYVGDRTLVRTVLAKMSGTIPWASDVDMCFARGILSGNVELRAGLTATELHRAGWVFSDGFAYDILGARSYKTRYENGFFHIDKSRAFGFPGVEKLVLFHFETYVFGASSPERGSASQAFLAALC